MKASEKKVSFLNWLFSKSALTGDDGVLTMRETAAAWFLVLSVVLTFIGGVVILCAITSGLSVSAQYVGVYIDILWGCYGMFLALVGISATKSGFMGVAKMKYGSKDNTINPVSIIEKEKDDI